MKHFTLVMSSLIIGAYVSLCSTSVLAETPSGVEILRVRETLAGIKYPIPLRKLLDEVGHGKPLRWLYGAIPRVGNQLRERNYFSITQTSSPDGDYAIEVEMLPGNDAADANPNIIRGRLCFLAPFGVVFYADDWALPDLAPAKQKNGPLEH